MRITIPLLFLFFIIPQIYAEITSTLPVYPGYWPEDKIISVTVFYPENGTTGTIVVYPIFPHKKTICQIYGTWKLSFEITNTNPYTVFVAIPDTVWNYNQSLPYSEDFQKLYISGIVATYVDKETAILNGERGIWIPPYTTVKVQRRGIFVYNLNVSVVPDRYKVIGPALMDTVWVFDEDRLENYLGKEGVKVGNYRLLVRGKIVKIPYNTEILSMVIPAPLVLKDYDSFNKLLGKYDVDIWVDSYRDYINKIRALKKSSQDKFNNQASNRFVNTQTPTFYIPPDATFIPMIDDTLLPINGDYTFTSIAVDNTSEPFDVPAMVFTTDDGDLKSLEFAYVMYKY